MELAGLNVLVTGGAGFIGSHLVDALTAEGPASLHIVDNFFLGREENLGEARSRFAPIHVHRMDATDGPALRNLLRTRRIEVVFNLATKALAYSFEDPCDAFQVNVQAALHLLEALRLKEISRLVQVSSSEAYGTARQVPMAESHPYGPHTPYAAGKAAADLLVGAYLQTFGTPALTLRPFNNYGPRQNGGLYAGLVPQTLRRLLRGESPVIQGTGEQTRDFIFVGDTVRIAVALAKRDDLEGSTLNLGTGVEVSVNEMVERICRVAGYTGTIRHEPARAADVARHCADVAALRAAMPGLSLISLDEGLARTWRWFRDSR